jgi:hypothetical protein
MWPTEVIRAVNRPRPRRATFLAFCGRVGGRKNPQPYHRFALDFALDDNRPRAPTLAMMDRHDVTRLGYASRVMAWADARDLREQAAQCWADWQRSLLR